MSFDFFSTTLREAEQKLTAAVPTGSGPDIYDIGSNISVNFIDNNLIDPNPPDVDAYLKSGAWDKFTVDFLTVAGKTYGLPFLEGSHASMYWDRTCFKEAGIAEPPATFAEPIEAARKLVKFDSQGRMIRSGISLRLSGQGSGIGERFRYIVEAAGGSAIPDELLEAAVVGAGEWWTFRRVLVPLSGNAMSAVGIFAFIQAWAAFIWPLLVANNQRLFNLEVGLTAFQFRFNTDYGKLMAGSTLSTLPMLIVFLLLRRRIIENMALTGING